MTKAFLGNRNAVESLAFLLTGLLCAQLSRDKGSAPDFALLHQLLFFYSALLLGLAAASYIAGRHGRSLLGAVAADCAAGMRRLKGAAKGLSLVRRSELLWLAGALCVGTVVRAYFLNQPMRYDESFSFLNFVAGGYHSLFLYPQPNNQVLNTFFEKLSCWLLGPTPEGIRLPAFLCGIGLIPLSFILCRKLVPGSFGLLAAYGVALSPYLILFSSSGRGYSMAALVVLLIVQVSLDESGTGVTGRWALPALLSALGMLIMPSMVYPLAGLGLWVAGVLALQTGSLPKAAAVFLIPYAAATAMLTLVFYTPVIWVNGGIGNLTANQVVLPLPADQFIAGILPHLVETVHDFSRDIPSLLVILVMALALAGTYAGFRERNRALALLLPAVLLGALVLFVLKRSIPPPRTWTYMIPLLLICADAGFSFLGRNAPSSFRRAVPAVVSVAAIIFVWRLMAHEAISTYPDTGSLPEAARIAAYLSPDISQSDLVCAEVPVGAQIAYYLWRDVALDQYRVRPNKNKKFFVHWGGAPLPAASWGNGSATIVLQSPDFVLYDWSNAADRPKHDVTCWSPVVLAYNLQPG